MLRTLLHETRLLLRLLLSDVPARTIALALIVFVVLVVITFVGTCCRDSADFLSLIHEEIELSKDGSMGEIVNYGVAFLASVLFFLAFAENRSPMLLFLGVLMAFVWFDDATSYHERFGRFLDAGNALPKLGDLREQDTGEMIAWAIAALVLAPLLVYSLLRRRPGDLGVLALVSVGFGTLVIFAVVVDMLHVVVPQHLGRYLGVIEDGGEMVAVALIAGVALGLSRNARRYYSQSAAPPT